MFLVATEHPGSKPGIKLAQLCVEALEKIGFKNVGNMPARLFLAEHAETIFSMQKRKQRPPAKSSLKQDKFLSSYHWRKARMQVLTVFGPVCMCCGASKESGAVMNVDHILPRKTNPELSLSLDNLQVLCDVCNHGKGNWDTTDWRTKEQKIKMQQYLKNRENR